MTIPDPQLKRWIGQWERGWSYRRIGERARVSETTVRQALAGKVTPRRPGPRARPKPKAAAIVRIYERTGSLRATAAHFEVSVTYISARLYDAGLIEKHPDQRPRRWSRHKPPPDRDRR